MIPLPHGNYGLWAHPFLYLSVCISDLLIVKWQHTKLYIVNTLQTTKFCYVTI